MIFYGTIVHVFFHIQKMMNISEEIVSINNVISIQSKVLIENLLEMDASVKKYSVRKNEDYKKFFNEYLATFNESIRTINHLSTRGYTAPAAYSLFLDEFNTYSAQLEKEVGMEFDEITWVDEPTLNTWLALLVQLRDLNQSEIDESLMLIHDRALLSTQNGLFGLGFSVVTALFAVWFISKSIITPLKELTRGLRTLSQGDYSKKIIVSTKDEFHDLATAYSDMSAELREQENLRTDFIATLSHEIRTPLSSIQESVNMLTEEVLGKINERQHKFLSIASLELTRITNLLNHLMDVSRLESTVKSTTGTGSIKPDDLVIHCTEALSGAAQMKNIDLICDIQKNHGFINGRKDELQQILLNVIGNAVKFAPSGSEVRISVLKPDNSEYVLINVMDQGPGIPDDEKSLIFNKYYRSKSIRNHMDGVGLGLYISQKLAQSVDGTIQVSNNPDLGCTFTISFPTV